MPFLGEISSHLAVQAHRFLAYGWSVIPLRGDSDSTQPKAPALASWRAYQKRLPGKSEIDSWFDAPSSGGQNAVTSAKQAIGIVLGRVSNLVVLDLDDPERAEAFARELPHLTQTFTVISGNRRLPHYYFRMPSDLYIPSRSCAGVELRSDGQYVVAPGSVIGDGVWRVVNDVTPRILSGSDLSALLRFLQAHPQTAHIKCEKTASDAFTADLCSESEPLPDASMVDAGVLVQRYRRLAEHHGRNNALFSVTLLARDCGWSQDRVSTILTPVHVEQSPVTAHHPETPQQRSQEAAATINSAYSRPPRARDGRQKGLPNSIREKLLAAGQVNVARLLDAMLMGGIQPGQMLTVAEVYERVGKSGIGRNAIYAALKARLSCGTSVFETVVSPLNPPSLDANAAIRYAGSINQCLVDRVANPVKNRGRPATTYRMPSIEHLCALLDVQDKGSDRLAMDDLRSPAAYRAALHAAFIRRAPGQYSRQWLADRLGVSRDSCRRYERRRNIHVQSAYQTWDVTHENADGLLPEYPEPGCFLEDERGKRYPPLPVLARMLLGHGRKVVFRVQRSNHYSTTPPLRQHAPIASKTKLRAPWAGKSRRKNVRSDQSDASRDTADGVAIANQQETKMLRAATIPADAETKKCCGPQQFAPRQQRHHVPAVVQQDDPEAAARMAERVYTQIRAIKPERALTRRKAATLVETYGCALVTQGMRVLESRQNIRNPAGFLMSWLRSESAHKQPSAQKHLASGESAKMLRPATIHIDAETEKCCGPQQFPTKESIIETGLTALEARHQQWLSHLQQSMVGSPNVVDKAHA